MNAEPHCYYCQSEYVLKVGEGFYRCQNCERYFKGSLPYTTPPLRRVEEEEAVREPPIEVSYESEFEEFLRSVVARAKKMDIQKEERYPSNIYEFNLLPDEEKDAYREGFKIFLSKRKGG